MSKIKRPDNGGPAFPCPSDVNPDGYQSGMCLRDWFAGQALAGLLAFPLAGGVRLGPLAQFAVSAYMFADAMLAEREKGA